MKKGRKMRRGRRIVDMSAAQMPVWQRHARTIHCGHLDSDQLRAELRLAKRRGFESRALINARSCYKCRHLLVVIES